MTQLAELRAGQERLAEEVRSMVSFAGGSSSMVGGSTGATPSEMGSSTTGMGMGGVFMREGAWCGHDVRKPPRKVGRRIVGYVYEGKDGNGKKG
jgi:hypothetical protein